MPVIARAARVVGAIAVAVVGVTIIIRAKKSVRTSDAASLCASTYDDDDDGDGDDGDDDARRHRCDAHRARAARYRVSARRAPDEDIIIIITIHVSIGEATHKAAGNARVVVG